MFKKVVILLLILVVILVVSVFLSDKQEPAIKASSTIVSDPDKKICDGKGNCTTEAEYQEYLNAPDYLCNYYQKSIWKESERAYGKKQYKYTEEKLKKIKALKDEGKSLCESGKLKEGETKLEEAIKIISFTMLN